MMQMLANGGIDVVTDHQRIADLDNPRGYFEFEAVKDIEHDISWLPKSRGKAVKMISMLLFHLPPTETYRILFLERDLDEVLASQETMLRRLNRPAAPRDQMRDAYQVHLDHLSTWLQRRSEMSVLRIGYRNLIQQTQIQAERICEFLGNPLDVQQMLKAVDPTLYRNRHEPG